jgi:hypothetical protein
VSKSDRSRAECPVEAGTIVAEGVRDIAPAGSTYQRDERIPERRQGVWCLTAPGVMGILAKRDSAAIMHPILN